MGPSQHLMSLPAVPLLVYNCIALSFDPTCAPI